MALPEFLPSFVSRQTCRFDLKLKSGELPPGEERGAIEITTQWFYNPNITAKGKKKKVDLVPRWLQHEESDTEVFDVCVFMGTYYIRSTPEFKYHSSLRFDVFVKPARVACFFFAFFR